MAKAKTIVAGLVIGVVAYLVALKLLKPKPMVKVAAPIAKSILHYWFNER
jgi:hypothetical protein